MAGDWIKMRSDIYRDPRVCMIADSLMQPDGELAKFVNQNTQRDMTVTRNVMRNVTVGALVSVWGVMRVRGKRRNDDLEYANATIDVLDDVADIPGFGAAMRDAGWVECGNNGLIFRNFFNEYNTDPADVSKAKAAERQRKFRETHSNVTRNAPVTPREEKSREEIKARSKALARATRLPDDWQPTGADVEFATTYGVDPATESEKFRDYWRGIGGARGCKLDWSATWRNWCRKAGEIKHGTQRETLTDSINRYLAGGA